MNRMADDDLATAQAARWEALWQPLRAFTAARIGLPRAGASLGTPALLDFRLAHARARDAVSTALDIEALSAQVARLGLTPIACASQAADAQTYLMRPDLGRLLDAESRARLQAQAGGEDLAIVLADGLSAGAIQQHAIPLLQALLPALQDGAWSLAPVAILRRGRVAAGDAIAAALAARCVVILIGERPGLSSPDSMSAYITWAPKIGCTDADRNCISNIRPAGLPPEAAASKLAYLLGRMRTLKTSGVTLKDDMAQLRNPS
jgi:ethanolamine ammonia-lyase small subunit